MGNASKYFITDKLLTKIWEAIMIAPVLEKGTGKKNQDVILS